MAFQVPRGLSVAPRQVKVKLSLCLTKHYDMKASGGVDV
jgi:hypothetical protein